MKQSKSSLFLLELIIAILFFSISSAVCVQLFVKSHLIGKETINQNQYCLWSQNLAELWIATDGNLEKATTILNTSISSEALALENGILHVSLDAGWKPCNVSEEVYGIYLDNLGFLEEDNLNQADISILDTSNHELLYSMSVMHHIAERSVDIHE